MVDCASASLGLRHVHWRFWSRNRISEGVQELGAGDCCVVIRWSPTSRLGGQRRVAKIKSLSRTRPKQLSAPTYGINMLLSFSELCGISLIGGETAALLYGWSRQAVRRRKLNVAVWNLTQARVFGLKAEAAASISTR